MRQRATISRTHRIRLDSTLTRRLLKPLLTATLLVACSGSTQPSPHQQLKSLADRYWTAYLDRLPEVGTYQGVANAAHDRLTDVTPQATAEWQRREDSWLKELGEIEASIPAGSQDEILAATLREALEAAVQVRVCRDELWYLSDTWSGWQQFLWDWVTMQPVGNAKARSDAISRWRSLPQFIDQQIENLRVGLARGYVAPQTTTRLVIAQIQAIVDAPDDESPLLDPARRDGDPEFLSALKEIQVNQVHPALLRYRDFLQNDYLPAARSQIGVSAIPNGLRCYAASVRAHTTLQLTAEEIQALGIEQMDIIEQEMRVIAERSFDTSDVPALLERFRSDPAFTYQSSEDLMSHVSAAVDRARLAMPRYFGLVPRSEVVVQPQPAGRRAAGDQYNGPSEDGSLPGVYLIDASQPTRRSRCGSESTAFHETIPGHHLQAAIALERSELHPLQRFVVYDPVLRYNGGLSEGWGLYSEQLADEMGLFSGDLDRLGMLSQMAWRAARLVVDPGMHVLGWTREQAIAYMMTHTAGSQVEVESEVDRYIAWPGQAVGYMIGSLEIWRLRREAGAELGTRFDIRAFHDRVLEDGNVPMAALRRKIEAWVASHR